MAEKPVRAATKGLFRNLIDAPGQAARVVAVKRELARLPRLCQDAACP